MPAWIRGAGGRIEWVNEAYARAVEADESEIRERQIELLDQRQRAEADAVLAGGGTFSRRLSLNIAGARKPHDVIVMPLGEASAAVAIDVTAEANAQGELDRQVEAYDRTLDRVATAVAIFGRDRKLGFYNNAFQGLWQLDGEWLASRADRRPGARSVARGGRLPEVVSRGEEQRRGDATGAAPEAVNYREWKTRVLGSGKAEAATEEGRTCRMGARCT